MLALILFTTFGGFVVGGNPTAAGQEITGNGGKPEAPIPVGPITIHPAPGWTVAEQIPDPPQLRLTSGAAQLFVVIPPSESSPEGHLQSYLDEVLEPQARQLSVSRVRHVELPSGQLGSLLAYLGSFDGVASPLEGEVLAVVSPTGTPVLFDGWAPEGLWVGARDEVRSMVATAEIP
ncbi:MAG: hypothetical protein ACRDHB_05430 [Actinomycetota bacterium]